MTTLTTLSSLTPNQRATDGKDEVVQLGDPEGEEYRDQDTGEEDKSDLSCQAEKSKSQALQ